ncbi:hypothetical protein ABPG73_008925, partial [Tetrahymena malaccensis]
MKGMLDEIIKSHSHSQVLKGTLAYYGYDEKGLTRIEPILNENYKIQLEDLITQTGNRKKTLQEQDLTFLKSIFKLDHYITSGGEADIFVNVQQQVAFRVIKIDDKALKNNLSELHNV